MVRIEKTRNSITQTTRSTLGNPFLNAMNSIPESTQYRIVLPWEKNLKTFSVVDYNNRLDLKERVYPSQINRLRDKISKSANLHPEKIPFIQYLMAFLAIVLFSTFLVLMFEFVLPKFKEHKYWYLNIVFFIVCALLLTGLLVYLF